MVQLLVGAKKKSNGANDRHSENSIIQAICLPLCSMYLIMFDQIWKKQYIMKTEYKLDFSWNICLGFTRVKMWLIQILHLFYINISNSLKVFSLISKGFPLWLKSPKNVPNHDTEYLFFRWISSVQGRDLAPFFLEIWAKMKTFRD